MTLPLPSDTPDEFFDTFLAEDYEPDYDYPENPDDEAWWDYADRRALEIEALEAPVEVHVQGSYL